MAALVLVVLVPAGIGRGQGSELTVAILQPAEGAVVSGLVNVAGTASASNGTVELVEVRIDQGPWNAATGTTDWAYVWDATSAAPGSHTIEARSVANGTTSPTVSRNVSVQDPDQPPSVQIVSPSEGATVSGQVTISGTASDPDGSVELVEVGIDSGPWQPAEGTTSWTRGWNTSAVADGPHTIRARATSGGVTSPIATRNVTVDNPDPPPPPPPNQPPTVRIDRPAEDAVVSGVVAIEGVASDPEGTLQRVELRIDGGAWTTASGTSGWSFAWNSASVAPGSHLIEARSFDGALFSAVAQRNATVDVAPPPPPPPNQPPTIRIDEPLDGARVLGTIQIRGAASDPNGDTVRIEVRIDDGPWRLASGSTNWAFSWNTSTVPNGGHTVQARALDGTQTTHTEVRGVWVENPVRRANRPPTVALLAPASGAVVNGSVPISGNATDPDGNLVRVEVRVDGGAWLSALGLAEWYFVWDTAPLEDGPHVLEARGVDKEGPGLTVARIVQTRNARDEPLEPAVANTPPTLVLGVPKEGDTVTDVLRVEGTVADADADGALLVVEARIDGGDWTGALARAGQPFRFELNVTDLAAGEHLLTVRVTDGGNATTEVVRAFLISEAETLVAQVGPPEAGASPLTVGVGLFVVLLLLGGSGLYFWSRQ